jgi:hypothetical protein
MIADLMIYLGCAALLPGAIFTLLAAIGVLRLPDLYMRMHAASKAGAVGGGLILLAVGAGLFRRSGSATRNNRRRFSAVDHAGFGPSSGARKLSHGLSCAQIDGSG